MHASSPPRADVATEDGDIASALSPQRAAEHAAVASRPHPESAERQGTRGIMGAPLFQTADYHEPREDLQVRDEDGSWRAVSTYRHKKLGTLVLFFGGTEYEGKRARTSTRSSRRVSETPRTAHDSGLRRRGHAVATPWGQSAVHCTRSPSCGAGARHGRVVRWYGTVAPPRGFAQPVVAHDTWCGAAWQPCRGCAQAWASAIAGMRPAR